MVGLEVEDTRAIAVRIDDRGDVQARAVVAADGGDLATAAARALTTVAVSGTDERVVGVAAAIPDSPAIAAVVAGLAPPDRRGLLPPGAPPSRPPAALPR